MAEESERKHREASAPLLTESLRLLSDVELSSLWDQSRYGQRGELPYREWLRRTGYPDMTSARNTHARYQDIAHHLRKLYGLSCAELTELTMHERKRRQKLRYGRITR